MRDRDRDEGCVRAGLPRRSPSPLSPLAPFPSTCAARRFLVDIRESAWMWVSVLRAKVKPVARVVEVGRIRVTDQRAPREPAPGKPPRCGTARRGAAAAEGPRVSSRARIASKTRARCTRLSACLFVFLPSFVLSPFVPLRLSFAPDHLVSSFLPESISISFSLHEHPAFSFAPRYPSPIVRARLSILFRCPRALCFLPHSALSSLLFSPLPSQFLLSVFLSSHRLFLLLVRSLLALLPIYPLAAYLPLTT